MRTEPTQEPYTFTKDQMRLKPLAILTLGTAMLLTATLAAAQPPAQSGTSAAEGWKTVIYPIHAWLPVFGAEVTLPQLPAPPGSGEPGVIPSAKTSRNVNGAALAGFRVERARLSIEGQFLWAGMTGSVEAPNFHLSMDTISFRVLGGFEVVPALYIDAGVRRLAVNMTASILDFQPVTWKPGIWEPVVGVTFRPQLSKNLRLFSQANVGFSGDDSSRSGTVTALVEWKPLSHLSIGAGWGWMYVRAEGTISNDRAVHFSQTLNGPQLTLGIPF